MSRSVLFELIQGYGGVNDWVKYYVSQCMKSEVIEFLYCDLEK